MSPSAQKYLFTLSALFNWLVGLGLFFAAGPLLEFFQVTPLPTESTFPRLFALLVFVFGFGYYAAGTNLPGNTPIIRLGAWAKLGVVAVVALEIALGNISWQLMLLAGCDLLFAILFFYALASLPKSVCGLANS